MVAAIVPVLMATDAAAEEGEGVATNKEATTPAYTRYLTSKNVRVGHLGDADVLISSASDPEGSVIFRPAGRHNARDNDEQLVRPDMASRLRLRKPRSRRQVQNVGIPSLGPGNGIAMQRDVGVEPRKLGVRLQGAEFF